MHKFGLQRERSNELFYTKTYAKNSDLENSVVRGGGVALRQLFEIL